MEWNDIVVTCTTMFALMGGILLILNIVKAIKDIKKPHRDIADRVTHCEGCLDRDNKRITKIEDDTAMLLKSQYALMLHFTTNNSLENLKKKQDELLTYLAERK